ncbi:MAG: hypothetical protein KC519_08140 [Anaerolineae bacterium]|nr:hypothetical protein [Anaerolineae bacterium]
MSRWRRNYVPFLDEEYRYGDDIPFFQAGCRSLLMLFSGAIVVVWLGLPFWTSFQLGRGTFSHFGCLVKALSLLSSLVGVVAAAWIALLSGTHILQVLLRHDPRQLSTLMPMALMFSGSYLGGLVTSYCIGYLKRSRPVLR